MVKIGLNNAEDIRNLKLTCDINDSDVGNARGKISQARCALECLQGDEEACQGNDGIHQDHSGIESGSEEEGN